MSEHGHYPAIRSRWRIQEPCEIAELFSGVIGNTIKTAQQSQTSLPIG